MHNRIGNTLYMETCSRCSDSFSHSRRNMEFYASIEVPPPTLCPHCRNQERCAFRNERTLYNRNCDCCKKPIITMFNEEMPFPVYCPECWWGDSWDGLDYGREFDPQRPFFEQLQDIRKQVPRLSLNNGQSENSDYCNQCIRNKNSYLLFAADDNEDSMYGYWINRCKDTFNSSNLADCTLCFDCIDSENCYNCKYCQDLKSSSDCWFSFNLINCSHCIRCAGLRNKKYHIDNKPYEPEEYERIKASLNMDTYSGYSAQKKHFYDIRSSIPHKYIHIQNSENCRGDYIINSKQCDFAFDIFDAEDCSNAFNVVHQSYNNRDVCFVTECRNAYQTMSTTGEGYYFVTIGWFSSDLWYSDLIQSCQHIFGSVGLRNQSYCILNKKYDPEAYDELKNEIVEHMKRTGEWGRFFPVEHSPFAYNETVAKDFYPRTKEEISKLGWYWFDTGEKEHATQSYTVADRIIDESNDITNTILECDTCNKNYRILAPEFEVYKRHEYPIPRDCPECRFQERLALRNSRELHERTCAQCNQTIVSTYAPDRPEIIICEDCYMHSIYG